MKVKKCAEFPDEKDETGAITIFRSNFLYAPEAKWIVVRHNAHGDLEVMYQSNEGLLGIGIVMEEK